MRIVIDADIATAASGPDGDAHEAIRCTEFLDTFCNDTDHIFIACAKLIRQWEEHGSLYSMMWFNELNRKERIVNLGIVHNQKLLDAIAEIEEEEGYRDALRDDSHLIEDARITDKRITSKENNSRRKYARLSIDQPEIGEIMWINPTRDEEHPIDWLRNGADHEENRTLRNYPIRLPGQH